MKEMARSLHSPIESSTAGLEREYSPRAPTLGHTCGNAVAPRLMIVCASYSAQKSVSGKSTPMPPMMTPPMRPLTMCRGPSLNGTSTFSRIVLVMRIQNQPRKPPSAP